MPIDGYFGVNRSLPGFSGLGNVSLRVRPAKLQSITLPPVPYLQEFPVYTTFSTATAAPGIVPLSSQLSCALLYPLCTAISNVVALTFNCRHSTRGSAKVSMGNRGPRYHGPAKPAFGCEDALAQVLQSSEAQSSTSKWQACIEINASKRYSLMPFSSRHYSQAWDRAGGLLVSYTMTNLDPFNAIEIGALSIPLVFQASRQSVKSHHRYCYGGIIAMSSLLKHGVMLASWWSAGPLGLSVLGADGAAVDIHRHAHRRRSRLGVCDAHDRPGSGSPDAARERDQLRGLAQRAGGRRQCWAIVDPQHHGALQGISGVSWLGSRSCSDVSVSVMCQQVPAHYLESCASCLAQNEG